jgi:uncharacterized coiled-coil protein SlyX
MKTIAELEQENADLRRMIDRLKSQLVIALTELTEKTPESHPSFDLENS